MTGPAVNNNELFEQSDGEDATAAMGECASTSHTDAQAAAYSSEAKGRGIADGGTYVDIVATSADANVNAAPAMRLPPEVIEVILANPSCFLCCTIRVGKSQPCSMNSERATKSPAYTHLHVGIFEMMLCETAHVYPRL